MENGERICIVCKPTDEEKKKIAREFCRLHPTCDVDFILQMIQDMTQQEFDRLKVEINVVKTQKELRDA